MLLTLIPFVAVDYWWIRMFDFPHLQLTFLTLIAILVYFIRFDFKNYRDYLFIGVLTACFIFQFIKIFPYTSFAKFEVLEATKASKASIKLFTANVLQDNENSEKLFAEVKKYNADLLLLTEVNKSWQQNIITSLPVGYKYKVEYPLNNTYGMVLYSKLPLIDPEIKFLVNDSIPSIHTKVELRSKDLVQIFAIHPTPPMPQENPKSTDRDSEMMQIAFLSRKSKLPVVVLGDFNDVAWSESSKLFQRVSELIDIRKGRGLFNTYNANSFLLRWPLDHVFISEEFRYIDAERVDDIDSDHFPIYAHLSFEPGNGEAQKAKAPSDSDLKAAKNQINKEKTQDTNSQ